MNIDDQIARLSRRIERVVSEGELRAKLKRSAETGTPLRIKLGMDPTAPDVTLGHCVPLLVVRQFQDMGHKAVLIIGDYTARVGDPTGRNTTRPALTGEQIDANAVTYAAQLGKVLLTDPAHFEIRYNGEWLKPLDLVDLINLTSQKTVAQIMAREDFANRFAGGVDIRLHEILYPLLQGYDSVVTGADVEMGGSDQLFNNLVGRDLQKDQNSEKLRKAGANWHRPPRTDGEAEGQCVIVTPLLVGTDGVKKMSKSLGNYIGVTDPAGGAGGMFGKVMSLPDALLGSYYTLLTDLPTDDFEQMIVINPRDAKVRLAKHLITWLHDAAAADLAEKDFLAATHGGVPSEMPELAVAPGPQSVIGLLVSAGIVGTNSEAMRKIREGAVKLDGEKIADTKATAEVASPRVLQMGSRRFVRLIPTA